jgi:hypothetical protein
MTIGVIVSLLYSSELLLVAAQTPVTNVTQGPPGEQTEPVEGGNLSALVTTTIEGDTVQIPGPLQFEVVESTAVCSSDTTLVGGGYRITEGVGLVLESLHRGMCGQLRSLKESSIS